MVPRGSPVTTSLWFATMIRLEMVFVCEFSDRIKECSIPLTVFFEDRMRPGVPERREYSFVVPHHLFKGCGERFNESSSLFDESMSHI